MTRPAVPTAMHIVWFILALVVCAWLMLGIDAVNCTLTTGCKAAPGLDIER